MSEMPTVREVLEDIKARLAADRRRPAAWIVDADDLEIRMDATYAAGKVASFIASAPANVARLTAALEAVLAYGADREKYTDTGSAAADRAIRSYAYHVHRIVTEALQEP